MAEKVDKGRAVVSQPYNIVIRRHTRGNPRLYVRPDVHGSPENSGIARAIHRPSRYERPGSLKSAAF